VLYEQNDQTTILLGIEDITERRAKERELRDLLQQKEVLLQEMQHRVANSFADHRQHSPHQGADGTLGRDAAASPGRLPAHHVGAAVQQQPQASESGAMIELAPYLSRLCETLAASMVGDRRPISLQVQAQGGTASSSQAVSIALIVTELIINAIKHAFPGDRRDGTVVVR
jgi:two-component sensor histidine kinase